MVKNDKCHLLEALTNEIILVTILLNLELDFILYWSQIN